VILPTTNGRPVKRVNYATEVSHGKTVKQDKQTRNRYSDEYKSEALALAARMGVASAAKQLGLNESQLYAWRGKARTRRDAGRVGTAAERRERAAQAPVGRERGGAGDTKKSGGVFAIHQKCGTPS